MRIKAFIGILFRRKLPLVIFIALFLIPTLLTLVRRHNLASHIHLTPADRLRHERKNGFERASPDLHLLVPATQSNVELCKGLLSALILGYPVPTLINWGQHFEHIAWRANGTHIAKITGVQKYLQAVEHQDHLVMVIDGYDTIFQLRPDVLFKRYRSINRGNMDRTILALGKTAIEAEDVSQSILFSAEKNCGPLEHQLDKPGCYAQPESPVRFDLYGPGTDELNPETHLPVHMRPAFLNAGLMIGPVREMRMMMEHAQERINDTEHEGSDQHIFNDIFGEQQYQREVIRQRHQSLPSRLLDWSRRLIGTNTPLLTDENPEHVLMDELPGHPLEFGIGLDYALEIAHSMVFSEFDGRLLTFNDTQLLIENQSGLDTPSPPRATSLPMDIATSTFLPFEGLEMLPPDSLDPPAPQDWSHIRLWTNMWTANIPVTLHMNGFKGQRKMIWEEMWYRKRAKEMLMARAFLGGLTAYDEAIAAKDEQGETMTWRSVCHEYEEEIFGEAPIESLKAQESAVTRNEWSRQTYNSYYESYMPWMENKYLEWFSNDNKASYSTKESLKTETPAGAVPGVNKLQEGLADTVGGQIGTGGLGEGMGKMASKEGVDRAETGGGDEGKQAQGMMGSLTGGGK